MKKIKANNEARCAIIICALICTIVVGGALGCYFLHLHMGDNNWSKWYNFTSPFIAIANVIAFMVLTIAIYIGEDTRSKTHEQSNIQNTIIHKLQKIEKELAQSEELLRKGSVNVQNVYTIYIMLYRYANYFKNLPSLSILKIRKEEKKNATEILKQIEKTRDIFINHYMSLKQQHKEYSDSNDCKPLARELNYLIAYFEEFEISILQDISISVANYPEE